MVYGLSFMVGGLFLSRFSFLFSLLYYIGAYDKFKEKFREQKSWQV